MLQQRRLDCLLPHVHHVGICEGGFIDDGQSITPAAASVLVTQRPEVNLPVSYCPDAACRLARVLCDWLEPIANLVVGRNQPLVVRREPPYRLAARHGMGGHRPAKVGFAEPAPSPQHCAAMGFQRPVCLHLTGMECRCLDMDGQRGLSVASVSTGGAPPSGRPPVITIPLFSSAPFCSCSRRSAYFFGNMRATVHLRESTRSRR